MRGQESSAGQRYTSIVTNRCDAWSCQAVLVDADLSRAFSRVLVGAFGRAWASLGAPLGVVLALLRQSILQVHEAKFTTEGLGDVALAAGAGMGACSHGSSSSKHVGRTSPAREQ